MKILAWITLGIIELVLFSLAYYLVVGSIMFKFAFSHKSFFKRVMKKEIDQQINENKIDISWWDKVNFKKVSVTSFDKLNLVGHFFDNNSKKTVIVVHGFGGNYRDMQRYCQFFMQKNFNVLAIENRAHGDSEGNCVGFGWLDRLDIKTWVNFVNATVGGKIVLFGLSMGGTAVLCACTEKLENVEAIISDCAFSNGNKQIAYVLKKYKMLGKIAQKHLFNYTKRLYGLDIMQIDVTQKVKRTKIPILYIHGNEDTYVPIENLYDLYQNTPENLRDKFVVDGANHALAYATAGVTYEKKINDFLALRTRL